MKLQLPTSQLMRLGKKLQWGIAGLGRFSETAIIPNLQLIRKASVRSVYSSSALRAEEIAQKFGISYHYSDFDRFLSSGIEALYVGSTNADHYSQVMAALKKGIPVLCEKPLALSSEQALEMVEQSKKYNTPLAINYVYRYHPLLAKAKEMIDSHKIGKLLSISANFNINFIPEDNFRFKREISGGGVIRDLGTHMIDLFRYLGGDICEVKGYTESLIYQGNVEDFAVGVCKFTKSGYAQFNVAFCAKKASNRIEIIGHNGSLILDGMVNNRFNSTKLTMLIEGQPRLAFRKRANKLKLALMDVTNSFLNDKPIKVTGEDGLANLIIMEQFEKNASER